MKTKILLAITLFILAGQALYATAPKITSFSPASGQIGTLITIKGTNLASPTAFSVGGVTAIAISNTGTQLVGLVMPGAITGVVSVTTAGGSANSSAKFTVTSTATATVGNPITLGASGLENNDPGYYQQGNSVALSADGNTAAIGATGGEAFILARSGPYVYGRYSNWIQQTGSYPSPHQPELIANTGTLTSTVAISADGNTVAVSGTDNNGDDGFFIFTRSNNTWAQQGSFLTGTGAVGAPLTGAALALSADGNTVLFGEWQDNSFVGASWVFTRSGGVWSQQGGKIVGAGAVGAAEQGFSVALSADGNTAMISGLIDNGPDRYDGVGAAWVFTRSGGVWTQQGNKLVGTGYSGYPAQGRSVSLSADGNTALIGGYNDNNVPGSTAIGAAWVFSRSGGSWSQQGNKLLGTGDNNDYFFGTGTALSADGNTAIIGASGKFNTNGAALFEFTRSGSNWAQLGAGITLSATNTNLGNNVAMSSNATTVFSGITNSGLYSGVVYYSALPAADTTLAATNITSTGATLNGTVNGNGTAATVTMTYGTSSTLATSTTAALSSGTSPIPLTASTIPFTSVLTGLTPSTKYYFRINGTNSYGTNHGAILNFTTASGTLVPQTITFATPAPVTYGSPDVNPGATSTNSTIPVTYSSSNSLVATITAGGLIHIVGAGTTTITAMQAGNGGYSPAANVPRTFTVKPASLVVTADSYSKLYSKALPALKVTYAGFLNGDNASHLTALPVVSTTALASSPVGAYPTDASGAVDPNYTITYVAGAITITSVPLTITAKSYSKVYGKPNPALNVAFAGFVNGDTEADLTTQPGLNTTATTASPIGSYPITAGGAADPNYTITYVAGNLTVTPQALIIKADSYTKTYGKANPTLKVSCSGFVNGETEADLTTQPAINTTATTASIVGVYPITVGGAADANYTISYTSGTLTVTPTALKITAANKTKVAGAANPALTIAFSGFKNGETEADLTTPPIISTTATTASPAGTYPITVSGAVDANYNITYVNGTLTVNNPAVTAFDVLTAPQVSPALSPNGDGVNDVLTIKNIANYPLNKLVILDKSGNKVFEQSAYDNVNKAFDGHSNINGKMQPAGTYFYILQYHDNGVLKSRTGYVVVKY